MLGPDKRGRRGERCHAPDRALRQVALDRDNPIEPSGTKTVREPIDQRRQIRSDSLAEWIALLTFPGESGQGVMRFSGLPALG